MKPKLQRIEAMLSNLPSPQAEFSQANAQFNPTARMPAVAAVQAQVGAASPDLSTPDEAAKIPTLPPFSEPTSHQARQVNNPSFAMGLLKEMEGTVATWQRELYLVSLQIQEIYMEGPIVDGWLESHSNAAPPASGSTVLQHAELDHLMNYVQQIAMPQAPAASHEMSRTDYRLCGLDADGNVWMRPCPAEQVPAVSLAIARYQKLRQLLGRKQHLEDRLSQLAQSLVAIHSQLQEPASAKHRILP